MAKPIAAPTNTVSQTVNVLVCTCKHELQDELYGKGKRLANRMKPKEKIASWRCTVCGKEHKD